MNILTPSFVTSDDGETDSRHLKQGAKLKSLVLHKCKRALQRSGGIPFLLKKAMREGQVTPIAHHTGWGSVLKAGSIFQSDS